MLYKNKTCSDRDFQVQLTDSYQANKEFDFTRIGIRSKQRQGSDIEVWTSKNKDCVSTKMIFEHHFVSQEFSKSYVNK